MLEVSLQVCFTICIFSEGAHLSSSAKQMEIFDCLVFILCQFHAPNENRIHKEVNQRFILLVCKFSENFVKYVFKP